MLTVCFSSISTSCFFASSLYFNELELCEKYAEKWKFTTNLRLLKRSWRTCNCWKISNCCCCCCCWQLLWLCVLYGLPFLLFLSCLLSNLVLFLFRLCVVRALKTFELHSRCLAVVGYWFDCTAAECRNHSTVCSTICRYLMQSHFSLRIVVI